MKPIDPRAKAKRAALNALKRARRAAERAGVELSEWEGEFLGSVETRVEKYGRAFADPEKGAAGAPLSLRQGVKLKEISAKANKTAKPEKEPGPRRNSTFGKSKSGFKPRGGFKRRSPSA